MKKLLFALLLVSLTLLAQSGGTGHTVSVSWNASTDAINNPTLSYTIYRGPGDCSNSLSLAKVGGTANVTFDDAGVAPGTYCYTVRSLLNGAESSNANLVLTVIVPAGPTGVKTQPK
jgi:hypothetical protein